MHDNQEVFTITLIVDGDDTKLLFSASETPAKEDSDASGVIYRSDLPEQFNEIVSKIPIFSTAIDEEGSEESITHTFEEFQDMYELDLVNLIERGEEILHTDLDDDNEAGEDEEHKNQVLEPESSDELTEPDDIYKDSPSEENDIDFPGEEDAMAHIDPREALNF